MSIFLLFKIAIQVVCSNVCVQCILCVPCLLTTMKWRQAKRVASCLLLGFIFIQVEHCRSDNREVMIGGLFGTDEDDHIMNAFKYAVYRMNHDRDLLTNMKLIYDIKQLKVENRFEATKRVCDQISKGILAVFGPLNQDMAAYTGSACSSLRVPHLETRIDAGNTPPYPLSINLHPDTELLAKACLDVIKHFGWTEMLIIYGDQAGLLKIQSLLRASNETMDMTIIVRQADLRNMRDVLKEAKANRWQHIVAELNLTETALLLKMALQEGMIDSYHHYILNNMDIELLDLEDYRHNYVNLTGFRLLNYDSDFTSSIIYDIRLFEENTLLDILRGDTLQYQCALVFDAVLLFSKALRQLERNAIFSTPNVTCESNTFWSSGKTLYDYINSVKVKGLTGDISMTRGRRLNFKLDIMELGEVALQKTGTWDARTGVNITGNRFLGRGVFGNKTLIVSTNIEPPYAMLRKDRPKGTQLKGNDRFEGFCIDLLKEIAKLVGFDYQIVIVPDLRYGNKNSSGHWDGIVRELLERRADLSVAALTISYDREQYIDFTKPFLNLGISILFKVPKREKPGLFSFMNPLAIEIWIYVVAAYFVVSITIFVLARFSPYEWYNPHPCNPETDTVENIFTLNNSFWFCVGTLMQQGSDINPRAVSTRIVGSTWWLFTLIIISSYTANLAAFLTVERMVSPIESAEDLSKQTDISYGTLEGGSTMSFFRDSSIETYQRMWNFMESKEPSPFTKSVQEGIDRVLAGGYAYLMESTSIEYITQRNCNLMQIGGLLDSKGYGIATPMNSPLKEKLSMAILNLQEDGVIQKLYNKWWKSSAQCFRDEGKDSKANALGVENVGGIFVVLLGGLTLAIIVALIEFIVNSRSNARQDKQSLCSEMGEELRFAIRCGSSQKLKYKKKVCLHCKAIQPHTSECALEANRRNSANGVIHMRENRNSMISAKREMELDYMHEKHVEFGAGGYLHVEYSDTET